MPPADSTTYVVDAGSPVPKALPHSKTQISASFTGYAGPTPPPEMLRQYEDIHPGSAKIIFESFEKQGDHRRQLELLATRHAIWRSWGGLAAGTIIMLSIIGLAAFGFWLGLEVTSTVVALGGTGGLVAVFVIGQKQQRAERKERNEQLNKAIAKR